MSKESKGSEMEDCCRPGDGYLATKPVKSNGLSRLVEACGDKSSLTEGQRTDPFGGMKMKSTPKSRD